MINSTGNNVDVLITSRYESDWETFATWYSAKKSLPEANVCITCLRQQKIPDRFFQWTKRLSVELIKHDPLDEDFLVNQLAIASVLRGDGTLGRQLLILQAGDMVIDPLNEEIIKVIDEGTDVKDFTDAIDSHFLLGALELGKLHGLFGVRREAKEMEEIWPVVSTSKGIGRWIHTLKGCPLASAAGMASSEMTVCERRVIELWKKMTSLYSAVA